MSITSDNLVQPNILQLTPYVPGKPIEEVERELGITDIIKLASNENPLGPSPLAIKAMADTLPKVGLYPDGSCFALRNETAKHWGVEPENLIFGNGSDELIHYIGVTFLTPGDEVIQADPTFVRYEAAGILNNCKVHKVPCKDLTHDLAAMAERINERTKLIFIANPNNPTGTIVTKRDVEELMDKVPERCITVFDEAYYEYVEDPEYPQTMDYVKQGRNVIILRTFSKIYALAGLRIGYGIARPKIIEFLEQVREPFNVNSIAQVGAIASLRDSEQVAKAKKVNSEGRAYLCEEFDKMGLPYAPSQANFVLVNIKQDCVSAFKELLKRGVITRTGDIFGLPTYLRVTIGTMEQNKRFIEALKEVLG